MYICERQGKCMNSKQTEQRNDHHKYAIALPPVIFGTSCLGNLFVALGDREKLDIVRQCVNLSEGKVVFDTAGKYGAGLALETLGKCLRQLAVPPEKVIISNKLGWLRSPLEGNEPTFEPGVWKELEHDAVQKISYQGILECFEQGNALLGDYRPEMVSVHDPDEYLAAAKDARDAHSRYEDILDAYEALYDLKREGRVSSVGIGAKDWRVIRRLANDVSFDWIMIANSMTIKAHPAELLEFIAKMDRNGVYMINSAVFHAGFLVGGDYYDYRPVRRGEPADDLLLHWRDSFFEICTQFNVKPAEACVRFAFNVPGISSVALNTTNANRVGQNIGLVNANIPAEFWETLREQKMI
jgi:D-threo-aldose 1-dehydrogenase